MSTTLRQRAYMKDYYKKNRARFRAYYKEHRSHLRATSRARKMEQYGMNDDLIGRMLIRQGGACAVCHEEMEAAGRGRENFAIDHDHITGVVRGIAHNRCNSGLGHFNDSPDHLRRAALYLEGSRR